MGLCGFGHRLTRPRRDHTVGLSTFYNVSGGFSPAHLNNVNPVISIGGFLVNFFTARGSSFAPIPRGFGVFSRGDTQFL